MLFANNVRHNIAGIILQKSSLHCHINIDSGCRSASMTEQLFDDFYVNSLLNEEATAGVAEGVRGYLWVVYAYHPQLLLDNV